MRLRTKTETRECKEATAELGEALMAILKINSQWSSKEAPRLVSSFFAGYRCLGKP